MRLARHSSSDSAQFVGIFPGGRPLFVPPGIRNVRTGPTTRGELARLLADVHADADESSEVSGIRARKLEGVGLWLRVRLALGFAAPSTR